jgi:hypothetical protein
MDPTNGDIPPTLAAGSDTADDSKGRLKQQTPASGGQLSPAGGRGIPGGVPVGDWTQASLDLLAGWRNDSPYYALPSVRSEGALVSVIGLVKDGAWTTFAKLPPTQAPAKRLVFQVSQNFETTRVDVLNDGSVIYAGGSKNGIVSLDGIIFATSGNEPLGLLNGWSNFGSGFADAAVAKIGQTVVLQGLIKNDSGWRNPITTLPVGMRPAQRLVFGGSVHTSAARIDVMPDGSVLYVFGKQETNWLSLSGIVFTVGSTLPIVPLSPWSDYGGEYASMAVASTGILRPCMGMVHGDEGEIGVCPVSGRDAPGRRVFLVIKTNLPARMDLLPDGRLYYIAGGGPSGWISLSGIVL